MPMIALLPSKATQQFISEHYADHVVPSNELHVTIAYAPDGTDKIDDLELRNTARQIAKSLKPFDATITGTAPLGDATYVWHLAAPEEQFMRAYSKAPVVDHPGRYNAYKPHLTLTYDPAAILPEKPDFPLTFDRIAVAESKTQPPSEWYTVPLTGNIVDMPPVTASAFNTEERDRMADSGVALPDGSYPIRNRGDFDNAVQAIGRAKDRDKVERHIRKRARALDIAESSWPDWLQTDSVAAGAMEPEELETGDTEIQTLAPSGNPYPHPGYTPGEGWDSDEALETAVDTVTAGIGGIAEKLAGDIMPSGPSKPSGPGLKGKKQKCYMGSPATCKSVKWIRMYTALRNKGMTKEKAARISNERYNQWKQGRIKRKAFP